MNLKTIAQAFGAAILLCLLFVWPQISSHHAVVYHSFLPMQSLVWGVVLDLFGVTGLIALVMAYLQRSEGGRRNAAWAVLAAMLAPALVANAAAVWKIPLSHLYAQLLFYGTLLAALALRWLRPMFYQRAVRGARWLLLLTGCSLAWMAADLLYQGLRTQPADAAVPIVRAGMSAVGQTRPGRRIVWLLFDELSYSQAFQHRVSGLSMPAFDKFKSESVSFSNLKPAGDSTEMVVPSFLLGQVVTSIRSDLDGHLSVRIAGQNRFQPFDAHAALFSDAQRLGWTTGVVGWYNPYCRLLAGTLDYCFWRMGNGEWDGTSPAKSAFANAIVPLRDVLAAWRQQPNLVQEERHSADLAALMPEAVTLIRDRHIGFIFIHLSVPHPPGIYDRKADRPRPTGTYLDNLALADRVLGELMQTLNATPDAAKTDVIVCSDHSWRLGLWRPTRQWSEEEEAATHNRFDPRPVLMIHFAGETEPRDVSEPFEEIRMHGIIERMLGGQEPVLDKPMLMGSGAANP